MNILIILGSEDPEMLEIERILSKHGAKVQYAQKEGRRVHPGNAYQADPIDVPHGHEVVLVECQPSNLTREYCATAKVSIFRIDHHRPGDPGFDLPPEKYWEASSIGQLYRHLCLGAPTKEHRILAAMDHCMNAARQGKCHGVTAEEVRAMRQHHIALANGATLADVEATTMAMRGLLATAPVLQMGQREVVDFTKHSLGVGYSLEYLCTQEVLADAAAAAILATKDKADGPEKVVLCGAVSPETAQYFMSTWAPAQGLIDLYGAPARGYAGGYRKIAMPKQLLPHGQLEERSQKAFENLRQLWILLNTGAAEAIAEQEEQLARHRALLETEGLSGESKEKLAAFLSATYQATKDFHEATLRALWDTSLEFERATLGADAVEFAQKMLEKERRAN